jgi:hypothetical protein
MNGESRNAYDIGGKARRKETIRKTKWILERYSVGWGGMDLIDLAQDRHQWRAPVNTVMNHRLP